MQQECSTVSTVKYLSCTFQASCKWCHYQASMTVIKLLPTHRPSSISRRGVFLRSCFDARS